MVLVVTEQKLKMYIFPVSNFRSSFLGIKNSKISIKRSVHPRPLLLNHILQSFEEWSITQSFEWMPDLAEQYYWISFATSITVCEISETRHKNFRNLRQKESRTAFKID